MTGKLNLAWGYGSFELKRCYQRNLGLGITLAGLFHIIVIGGLLFYTNITTEVVASPPPQPTPKDTIVIDLTPPPPISFKETPQIPVALQTDAFKWLGIPSPVPDKEAPKDGTIPTQDELSTIADQRAKDLFESRTSDTNVRILQVEYLPPPDTFFITNEAPVLIRGVQPEYPSLAKQAGIEGVVWVKALVDKNGKVRNALILKASGASAGFEEAALEAVYKNEYKPAISNKEPVAVWVVYPVYFTLK